MKIADKAAEMQARAIQYGPRYFIENRLRGMLVTIGKPNENWMLTIQRANGKPPDDTDVTKIRKAFDVPDDAVAVTEQQPMQKRIGPLAMTTKTVEKIEWRAE